MSNGISGLNSGSINPYRQLERMAEGGREIGAARTEDARRGAPARSEAASDLSPDETRMIEQNFPPSPAMSLRIYSPTRKAHSVNPNGVGGRLDVKG